MSNTAQPGDHDSDPPPDASVVLGSLAELDEQLAGAASAAETLATGLGQPAPSPKDDGAPINTNDVLTPEQVMSEELTRLDGLAETVAAEVGVSPPESGATVSVSSAAVSTPDTAKESTDAALVERVTDTVATNPAEGPGTGQPDGVEEPSASSSPVEPIADVDVTPETIPKGSVSGVEETALAVDDLDTALAAAAGPDLDESDPPIDKVDTPPDEATTDPPPTDTEPDGNKSEAVPDFMRELMEETDEPCGGSTAGDAPSEVRSPEVAAVSVQVPSQTKPGVVGTGMLGVVGSTPPPPASPPSETDAVAVEPDAPSGDPDAAEDQAQVPEPRGSLLTRLTPLALQALERLATILDRIDRPLKRIGPRVRQLAGWAALATFGTALVVFVVALF